MTLVLLLDFIFLLLIRFFIKIVLTIFGWATDIFFGKLPDKNKIWFYLMLVLSFVWVYCLLAKAFPWMFNIFRDYIPEQSFTKAMTSFLYAVCVIGIPPTVGAMGAFITDVKREEEAKFLRWLLKGYRYSLMLGCTMAVILVCTPVIRIKRMLKHITAESIPADVAGRGNIYVMDEIIMALKKSDMKAMKKVPSKFYSVPVKMINGIMKELFDYVSDREFYVVAENVSIYLNSSDLMIEGKPEMVEKAKIAIVKGFVENDIYLTENEISRSIETKILTIYKNWKNGNASSDEALRALRNLTETGFAEGITYNDWALLSVQIYEAEHNILSKKPNC